MVPCKVCGRKHPDRNTKLFAWTCSYCVQDMLSDDSIPVKLESPREKVKKMKKSLDRAVRAKRPVRMVKGKEGWPMGWHRKISFTSPDGTKYCRGVKIER